MRERGFVWIDAICINQHDDKEKTQLVLLMQQIYSDVRQLCIWLGEPVDNVANDLTFDDLGRLEAYFAKYVVYNSG